MTLMEIRCIDEAVILPKQSLHPTAEFADRLRLRLIDQIVTDRGQQQAFERRLVVCLEKAGDDEPESVLAQEKLGDVINHSLICPCDMPTSGRESASPSDLSDEPLEKCERLAPGLAVRFQFLERGHSRAAPR
ncbi:hypothetical protein [Microbacterium aurum]|uniref:hypothetical protein n=1 Tax=Microbacterium aurum TaxID=36805 RepID=UPI0012F4C0D5|nr:hypothetical protein [Microbacterium aurum]MBM7826305.1 hypothetical protein [Microbacterium aurum]